MNEKGRDFQVKLSNYGLLKYGEVHAVEHGIYIILMKRVKIFNCT